MVGLPAQDYFAAGTLQHALWVQDGAGGTFDVGVLGSTDTHHARPGSVMQRREMAELHSADTFNSFSAAAPPDELSAQNLSYYYTGGLAAVHIPAATTDDDRRTAIYGGLYDRQVFGTSGPRMQLWFYLVDENGDDVAPMGTALDAFEGNPRFRVHALGAFPDLADGTDADTCPGDLGPPSYDGDFGAEVCLHSCHAPDTSAPRNRILRFEVIRVQRQASEDEVLDITADNEVWQTVYCAGDDAQEGLADCWATFEDPGFQSLDRNVVYYVRAIQEPTDAVNGTQLPCSSEEDDSCLSLVSERAWSSPIFLNPAE